MGSRLDPDRPRPVPDMASDAERRRQLTIRRIDAALARIEAGEYGYCAICGEQIAAGRLDREPTTSVCADCARPGGPT
ncbi:hypothetical protein STVA_44790 [Allostella vacuolata]|nr:hypothetical protein STVA_44790 [Stella vacuolata]